MRSRLLSGAATPILGKAAGGGDIAVGTIQYFEADPGAAWLKCDGRAYTPTSAPALVGTIPPNLGQPVQFGNVGGLESNYSPRAFLAGAGEAGIFLGALLKSNNLAEIPYSAGAVRAYVGAGTGISRLKVLNGLYFAVLDGGSRLSRSPTGIGNTWTEVNLPGGNIYPAMDVTFGNGLYVAVGQGGGLWTSPTGVAWTARTNPAPAFDLNGVTFGAGMFVAVGSSGYIVSSPNGIDWTERRRGSAFYQGVAFGNGTFATIGYNGGSSNYITSSNGIDWATGTEFINGTNYQNIKFQLGMFIACKGGASTIAKSLDGKTWSNGPILINGNANTVCDADIAPDGAFVSGALNGPNASVIFFKGSVLSTPVVEAGLTQKGKLFTPYMRIA